MRVVVRGGNDEEAGCVVAALGRGGLRVVAPADAFDLVLTLGRPDRAAAIAGAARQRLTRIERALLEALADAPRPLARAELLRQVWGYRFDPGTNLVAVHVHRLRTKIGHARIACAGGRYRLVDGEG